MKLLKVQKINTDEHVRLVGTVQIDNPSREIELYFQYPQKFTDCVSDSADAFVPALLLPAMEKGENLEIVPPVSEKLCLNLQKIQDIFHQWHPNHLQKITVIANHKTKFIPHAKPQVGSFFSLGVDSFYTLHKHINSTNAFLPSISHLIHMKGIEFPLSYYKENREFKVNERIREVANKTGIDCIFGETNIRSHFPLKWGLYYHGAGLASVALSLSNGFQSVLIPSTDSYKAIFHWGSSPLIDHWWSTEKVNIFHDGSEVERAEKTAKFLAKDSLAKEYLRVCLKNYGTETNCGQCTKCVRTMLPLQISGQLAQFKTFPDQLPKDWANILHINDDHDLSHAEAILDLAEEFDADKELSAALSRKIETARHEMFLKGENLLSIFGSIVFLILIKPTGNALNDWFMKLKLHKIPGKMEALSRTFLPSEYHSSR